MKKTFVLNGKGFFDEAGEEYELHDERVYVTQSNRVCLPGKAYLLMVRGISLIANGLEVTYNDGTTEFFTDYHELEKDSYFDESSGGFENGWGCSVLHKVYYSLDGYRLSVGEVYRRVEFRKGKKYFTDTMRSTRYTFNLETGESFTLPERRASGNTSFSNTTEFHRFSYFMDAEKKCEDIPDGIVEQILDIMLDYKQRKLGFKPTVSRNGFKNVVSFLASVNECPCSNQMLSLLPAFVNRYYFNKYVRDTQNPVRQLCKLLDIPYCSSIRKMYSNNPERLLVVSSIMATGKFKEFDNVLKLAGSLDYCSTGESTLRWHGYFMDYHNFADRRYMLNEDGIKVCGPLIRDIKVADKGRLYFSALCRYSEAQGLDKAFYNSNYIERLFGYYRGDETLVTNALCRKAYEPSDCIRMLEDIERQIQLHPNFLRRKQCPFGKGKKMFNQWLRKMYMSTFTKYVHDTIYFAQRWILVLLDSVRKIGYTEKEMKLEERVEDYSFELPRTTMDLINIGDKMRICVGGYGDDAVSKRLNIVVVRDQQGEPVVCIELDSECNKVRQVKASFNNLVSRYSDVGKAIYKWMKSHELDCSGTYDFAGPKVRQSDNDVFDFDMAAAFPEVV